MFCMEKGVNVILPMRAGSQRIIDKNIRPINGRPLYEYIINAVLGSKQVDKTIITTDIKEVLEKFRGNEKFVTLERPEHLRENCNMNWVIADTLTKVQGEHFLQLHTTSPLLTSETIDEAIEKYFQSLGNYDSLFSVTEKQMRFFDKNWRPINHKLEDAPTTQDLDPWYEENCILYLFSKTSFLKKNHRIGASPYLFKTSLIESVDLDTEEEFKLAEMLLKAKSI
jgi:CMP-N-acetylneuraminic acid synthetase